MNFKRLTDSSINRILKHTANKFFLLSPFRHEFSDDENKARWKEMTSELKSLGLGYIVLQGHWIEDGEVVCDELSALVVCTNLTSESVYDTASSFSKKFGQEAFIARLSPDDSIYQYSLEGDTYVPELKWDKLSISSVEDIWSNIKSGKDSKLKFKFTDTLKPSTMLQALSFKAKGIIY